MDLLDRMLGHDYWATTRLLDYSRGLTNAQLDQAFDIGHGTLRETFDHLIFTIDFWTSQMVGQPRSTERKDRPSLAELRDHLDNFHLTFTDVAHRAQNEHRLDDTFVDHSDVHQSLGATIIHVLLHNAQHRSDARHILERLGVQDLWDFDPQEWEYVTRGS